MNGATVADYRHVVGEDDFADDRDRATDENADVAAGPTACLRLAVVPSGLLASP